MLCSPARIPKKVSGTKTHWPRRECSVGYAAIEKYSVQSLSSRIHTIYHMTFIHTGHGDWWCIGDGEIECVTDTVNVLQQYKQQHPASTLPSSKYRELPSPSAPTHNHLPNTIGTPPNTHICGGQTCWLHRRSRMLLVGCSPSPFCPKPRASWLRALHRSCRVRGSSLRTSPGSYHPLRNGVLRTSVRWWSCNHHNKLSLSPDTVVFEFDNKVDINP